MLARVLMGKDLRASRVQPFIPICVVKVPVSVDKVFDWVGANARKSVSNLQTSACKSGIDEKLTVPAGKDRDISASTHENAYVAAQSLHRNGGTRCAVPSFGPQERVPRRPRSQRAAAERAALRLQGSWMLESVVGK